jgi:hypothetical protein
MPARSNHSATVVLLLRELLTAVKDIREGVVREAQVSEGLLHVPFTGPEIYLLHKAFVDAGGASHETYKSLLEKVAPALRNKTTRGFSVDSLQKASDKVGAETRENVKRFLLKMIRNIDSY